MLGFAACVSFTQAGLLGEPPLEMTHFLLCKLIFRGVLLPFGRKMIYKGGSKIVRLCKQDLVSMKIIFVVVIFSFKNEMNLNISNDYPRMPLLFSL